MSKLRSPMDIIAISAYYGMYDPFKTGKSTMHYGIDMTGHDSGGGDLIKLPHNGYIEWSGVSREYNEATKKWADNNMVVTKHWGVEGVPKGKYMICWFAHLYSISTYVEEYQNKKTPLEMGLIIGKEGKSGHVTGDHLHFGVAIVPEGYNFTTTTALRMYAVDPLDYMHCYQDQVIKYDPKNRVKKYQPSAPSKKEIVTIKGELLERNGDVFTVKGKII